MEVEDNLTNGVRVKVRGVWMGLIGLLLAHWANGMERTGLMGFMERSSPKYNEKKLMEWS